MRQQLVNGQVAEYFVFALEDFSLDPEGFEEAEAYLGLLKKRMPRLELAVESFRVFDNAIQSLIDVQSTTNQHDYTCQMDLEATGGGIDEGLVESFINNQILGNEGKESRLAVSYSQSIGQLCTVPPALYEAAIAIGVIPDALLSYGIGC